MSCDTPCRDIVEMAALHELRLLRRDGADDDDEVVDEATAAIVDSILRSLPSDQAQPNVSGSPYGNVATLAWTRASAIVNTAPTVDSVTIYLEGLVYETISLKEWNDTTRERIARLLLALEDD